MWRSAVVSMVALAAPACGGDPAPAAEQCAAYAARLCDRLVDCGWTDGDSLCLDDVDDHLVITVGFLCDDVTAVAPDYDACFDDLRTIDCGDIYDPVGIVLPACVTTSFAATP